MDIKKYLRLLVYVSSNWGYLTNVIRFHLLSPLFIYKTCRKAVVISTTAFLEFTLFNCFYIVLMKM